MKKLSVSISFVPQEVKFVWNRKCVPLSVGRHFGLFRRTSVLRIPIRNDLSRITCMSVFPQEIAKCSFMTWSEKTNKHTSKKNKNQKFSYWLRAGMVEWFRKTLTHIKLIRRNQIFVRSVFSTCVWEEGIALDKGLLWEMFNYLYSELFC